MSPPYRFEAVYDEGLVREAALVFVKRRFRDDRRLWTAFALLGVGSAAFGWWSGSLWPSALVVALPVLLGGLFALVWRTQEAAALERLRSLDAMRATFVLDEKGLSVTSRAGSMSLPWSAFSEVWEHPRFWIVATSANAYFTVPITTAAPETLAFARSKLGPALS